MDDKKFLKLAIGQSRLSVDEGKFPAGAVVILDRKIIASKTSSFYPAYDHAECSAIDEAFSLNTTDLQKATLYSSMEPCLMCLSRAHWAGIRRIVFAIGREKVNKNYYEGRNDNKKVISSFNEKIEYLQLKELQDEALSVVGEWEKISRLQISKFDLL